MQRHNFIKSLHQKLSSVYDPEDVKKFSFTIVAFFGIKRQNRDISDTKGYKRKFQSLLLEVHI